VSNPDNPIETRLQKLEAHSHEPVDIAPRIYDEIERMLKLGRAFYDVPNEDLDQAISDGLTTYNYLVPAPEGGRR